jgi:hypothetical protein
MPYKTPAALPNDYERELLTILIEEAAEVQQRATKMLRFGRDEVQPGQKYTARDRLSEETGDLVAIMNLCMDEQLIERGLVEKQIPWKLAKLQKYMQSKKTG